VVVFGRVTRPAGGTRPSGTRPTAGSRSATADARKLYDWLVKCSDKSQQLWTQERANKLVLAFGDRWQSECFFFFSFRLHLVLVKSTTTKQALTSPLRQQPLMMI